MIDLFFYWNKTISLIAGLLSCIAAEWTIVCFSSSSVAARAISSCKFLASTLEIYLDLFSYFPFCLKETFELLVVEELYLVFNCVSFLVVILFYGSATCKNIWVTIIKYFKISWKKVCSSTVLFTKRAQRKILKECWISCKMEGLSLSILRKRRC